MSLPLRFSLSHEDVISFREKSIFWASAFDKSCLINSNSYSEQNFFNDGETVEWLLAAGTSDALTANLNAWKDVKVFYDRNKANWIFGHLSYDLKNQVEDLASKNKDRIHFPLMHFFVPQTMIRISGNNIYVSAGSSSEAEDIIKSINETVIPPKTIQSLNFRHSVTEENYLQTAQKILDHIRYGDVYELNYCIEFFAGEADISPEELYISLNEYSSAPFSVFYKLDDKYLISASPERFLAKRSEKIYSQPIKGTIKRGKTEQEDQQLKEHLRNDPKERSENIMIVDLVRNDLSRSCRAGSVEVDELCGIYTFPHVHQMISTVSGKLKQDIHPVDVIKNAFPMGSMTGAPKVKAMELIEKYETTKRGLYSGAVGYFNSNGDFDFNVVIRSFQYNKTEKYLSVMAGGAITSLSDPKMEYEECLLKAKALLKVIS